MTAAAAPAMAAPAFQLPFPCNQSWSGNSSASSAHESYEIDFNRGSSADLGDTVVAAAAGRSARRPTNPATATGTS